MKKTKLSTALKYLRLGLNLSQEEVASHVRVSRQMLISWEGGQSFPTEEHFQLWKMVLIKELERVQIRDEEVKVHNKTYKTKTYGRGDEENDEGRYQRVEEQ